MSRRRARTFIKEGVVLIGFLNGIWVAVGVNPGAQLLGVLAAWVAAMGSGGVASLLVAFLPLALLVAALVYVAKKGGWMGVAGVALAFLGGAQIVASPANAMLLLLAGLVLGYAGAR